MQMMHMHMDGKTQAQIDDELDLSAATRRGLDAQMARIKHLDASGVWMARFDDSCLAVTASAEAREVAWLVANAPNDYAAGLVTGLFLNN
ncbi:MAG: hypothetical protein V4844_14560 [Pseudomonadota bacterium]